MLSYFGVQIAPKYIYFIGSSEALPPPLSEDEEHFLVERLRQGDHAVKTILIERNLRLVVYIARKFENTGVLIEDLVSIGSIGLIKAVNTFNPSRNIKLATYASRCIENEILMYLRRNQKLKAEVDKALLGSALSKLESRERQIMQLRFGLADDRDRTQKEVADLLGISQSYISRLEKRILGRLRREFRKME